MNTETVADYARRVAREAREIHGPPPADVVELVDRIVREAADQRKAAS